MLSASLLLIRLQSTSQQWDTLSLELRREEER